MDVEEVSAVMEAPPVSNAATKRALLILNGILLVIGSCGAPLSMRLYFTHGGKRVWLISFLQTSCWPLISFILFVIYLRRRYITKTAAAAAVIGPRLLIGASVLGTVTGLECFCFSYAVSRLPVSTSALIFSTQLVFNAGFAFVLVKQKFTAFSINAVVLLSVGAGMLALHSSSDRPDGESNEEYITGFVLCASAAVLDGLIFPLVELNYKNSKQEISYALVLQYQMVLCIFATLFSAVASLVNNDFQAISREAREFEVGETKYYMTLVCISVITLCYFMGFVGVIFCSSSLLSGIMIAVSLPLTEMLAVIFYHEKFQADKGVALALSLWGFISYFYGEHKHSNIVQNPTPETEISHSSTPILNV
ncbi:purine permease 3-like [Mercurialis annua]|uniref:purine permease 3-like n=1 Tax=Mercurialis annua TaxID=3986 RepID=UPI00215F05BE|nr:purine permease 3-like [Mercurialis annua]XP_050225633.1 purine permease 3-like [Mercurialis annua]